MPVTRAEGAEPCNQMTHRDARHLYRRCGTLLSALSGLVGIAGLLLINQVLPRLKKYLVAGFPLLLLPGEDLLVFPGKIGPF